MKPILTVSLFLCGLLWLQAGTLGIVGPLTDDASSGVNPLNNYTHAISGGGVESVNGVNFELLNGGTTPSNLNWSVSSVKNQINDNNGGWNPGAGGVSGPGLLGLFGSFTYNNNGSPGSNQTFRLTGLEPGQAYEFRLYVRKWHDTTERTQTVTFTAGAEDSDSLTFAEDRPENAPINMPSRDSAWYMSYLYTADGAGSLDVRFEIANAPGPGSFHMYGMTNHPVSADLVVGLDTPKIESSSVQGDLVGTLSASIGGSAATASYALVVGEGDADNDKFQIDGNQLEIGDFDFTGENSANGQQFEIRIKGTADGGAGVGETALLLTVCKDDDGDGLEDGWERRWAGDISSLSGEGGADLDGDTLTDFDEFQLSRGEFPGAPAYPDLNPNSADSDGDTLADNDELNPFNLRPATDPTRADTDGDGLTDLAETNTGFFENENDTGTDPTQVDADFDGARDGWEVMRGTDPFDLFSYPGSTSEKVSLVPIRSEITSGIGTAKDYTHAISGGGPATVNGVEFVALTDEITPENFSWSTHGRSKNIIPPSNNGDWSPALGGLSGQGLLDLFGAFTYSGDGGGPNSLQSYTLSGLTPGSDYVLRLYLRVWDTEGSGRPVDLTFTNGAEVITPFFGLPEDRPGIVLGNFNDHEAYYLSFSYTAEGTEVSVEAALHQGAAGNSGSFHMYGLSNEVAGVVDYNFILDNDAFGSWNVQGDPVGNMEAFLDGISEPSTFSLVAGEGGADNDKFQITGNVLDLGGFDFTGENSSDGQEFSIRVLAVGNGGVGMAERQLKLTISKDDDQDDLNDAWELAFAGNLTDLDGFGADFDDDGLSDLDEFQLSTGELGGPFPAIDPTSPDTDGDGITDGEEVFPTLGFRPPTDPTKVDTDGDGLSDLAETNTFEFASADDTGTDPTQPDSDGDGFADGSEIEGGSDPLDFGSRPPLPDHIALVQVADDATVGIDSDRVYTHTVSGGNAATVNGVNFVSLNPEGGPANFIWDTYGRNKNQIPAANGDWNPGAGGLTGPGLPALLSGFTYSGNGADPGSMQSFTLQGLTAGQSYEFRLYIRLWDTEGSSRPVTISLANGHQIDTGGVIPEDRPGDVLGNGNQHAAYYISYRYVAEGSDLTVATDVPSNAANGSGSFHMYALSNEETSGTEPTGPEITSISRLDGGDILIRFQGAPATTYQVTKSGDLEIFGPLDEALSATTDFTGAGEVVVPSGEASEEAEFYRLEEN